MNTGLLDPPVLPGAPCGEGFGFDRYRPSDEQIIERFMNLEAWRLWVTFDPPARFATRH